MPDVEHGTLVPGAGSGTHTAIGWPAFLSDAARQAQSLGAADIGKFALVSDTGSVWMLTGLGPTRWFQLASIADLTSALSTKANTTDLNTLSTTVAGKADTSALTSGLAAKADTTYVNSQDNLRALQTDFVALYNQVQSLTPAGSVTGPGSSTDNAIVRFDGTTGATLQNSTCTISDAGALVCTSVNGVDPSATATTVANHTTQLASCVAGPASAADNQIARFDGTTGKLVQAGASSPSIDDSGNIVMVGAATVDGVDVSALSTTVSGLSSSLAGKLGGSAGTTDNAIVRADGTGGGTTQGSLVTIDDSGNIGVPVSATVDGVDVSVLNTTVTNQGSSITSLQSSMTTVTAAPATLATDNSIVRADGTSRNVQTSLVTIDDTGNISLPASATVDGVDVSTLPTSIAAKADAAFAFGGSISGGTTTYTFVLSDANRYIYANNTGGCTITVPTNASVAIPAGSTITVVQGNTGQLTFSPAGGVTLYNPSLTNKTRVRYSTVTLTKLNGSEWVLSGDLAAT